MHQEQEKSKTSPRLVLLLPNSESPRVLRRNLKGRHQPDGSVWGDGPVVATEPHLSFQVRLQSLADANADLGRQLQRAKEESQAAQAM